jgi:translation initiation factor IF-3
MVRSAVYRLVRIAQRCPSVTPITSFRSTTPSLPIRFKSTSSSTLTAPPIVDKGLRAALAKPFNPPSIPFDHAQVVDSKTNGLQPLRPVADILHELPSGHFALPVSTSPPILRVRGIEEYVTEQYNRTTSQKETQRIQSAEKEVQVPWTSADGDLARKIESAKDFLKKGDKVSVIFAPRVGGNDAKNNVKPARKSEIQRSFEAALSELASKIRDDEIRPRSTTVFWRPKTELVEAAAKVHKSHVDVNKREREIRKAERAAKAMERQAKAAEAAASAPKLDFLVEQEEEARRAKEQEVLQKIREEKFRAEEHLLMQARRREMDRTRAGARSHRTFGMRR